jgi:predicted metal-dependent phosphoesterase TrpH
LILPGVEINTEEGHLLLFGVEKDSFGTEYILSMHRAEYARRIVDKVGGAMILAHPYRGQLFASDDLSTAVERLCQKPIYHLVDTIEVLNGRASERQAKFSRELLRQLNLKGVGGSDAHSLTDLPSSATFFERRVSNVNELVTELKAGRFRAVDLHHNRRDKQRHENSSASY